MKEYKAYFKRTETYYIRLSVEENTTKGNIEDLANDYNNSFEEIFEHIPISEEEKLIEVMEVTDD